MRHSIFYIALVAMIFGCKKKGAEIEPVDQCLTPTEVTIKLASSNNVVFNLVGTDSLSVGKVSWTIISPEKTVQIETNGKVLVTQDFSKSGEFRVTAVVETVCKTKSTLTRTETIQMGVFNKLWIKEVGNYADTTFIAIVESKEGGCVAIGTDDYTRIISLDASGNLLWRKDISKSGWGSVTSIVRADDGGYIMDVAKSESNYRITKISTNGENVWEKTFMGGASFNNRNGYNQLVKVINASDGGYILAGYSSSSAGVDKSEPPKNPGANNNYTLTDYWIIKVNSLGVKVWDRTFGAEGEEVLHNIVSTADGGYVLFGTSHSGISGDKSEDPKGLNDRWMVKISRTGVKEWDRSFVSGSSEMVALPDGSIVINTEYVFGTDNIGYMKISNSGKLSWQKYVQGKRARMFPSNDGFVMVGLLNQYNLMRFSTDGEIKNAKNIDLGGGYFSYPGGFATTSSGGLYGLVSMPSQQQGVVYLK
jgi:hypothetical protein